MVTSLSSFPLNDVENDADVSLTVSDRRASSLLDSEMTCEKIHTFLKNKAPSLVIRKNMHPIAGNGSGFQLLLMKMVK